MIIRDATPLDAPRMAEIYRQYVVGTTITFEWEPPGAAEMERRLTEGCVHYPWLVLEVDGQVAGYAYGGPYKGRAGWRPAAVVSIYLADSYHGQGFGSRLLQELLCRLRD